MKMDAKTVSDVLKTFMKDLFTKRLDWKFYPSTWVCIVPILLIYPAMKFLPEECGYENGLIENTQMAVIFITMALCFFARCHKKLFIFASFIFFIQALRETNFGKTVFYPDPEHPGEFLRWDEIWYAPYVDPALILYGVCLAVYFFRNKLYKPLFLYVRFAKIPVWNILIVFVSAVAGLVIDKVTENYILEEMVELCFYIASAMTVWLYGRTLLLPEATSSGETASENRL